VILFKYETLGRQGEQDKCFQIKSDHQVRFISAPIRVLHIADMLSQHLKKQRQYLTFSLVKEYMCSQTENIKSQ